MFRRLGVLLLTAGFGCAGVQADLEQSSAAGAKQASTALEAETPKPAVDPATVPARDYGVSEAEFRALHAHTDAAAPARRGERIPLGETQAYLSLPEGATGPVPAVIVIHEWWGLNAHIEHWADRLAAEGYAALAVDLYGGQSATTPENAMALMKAVDPAVASKILTQAQGFLREDARIQAPKVASIGWCFGGGWSLRAALALPLDAAVVYYGRVITDEEALAKLEGKLLGVFGNQDQGIPPKDVDAFEAALRKLGKDARILRYDANHAFANPSSGRYDAPAAEKAWTEVRAFLRAELTGGDR